jgi:DNA-binding transcriptional regulator GbsR (MarR family)
MDLDEIGAINGLADRVGDFIQYWGFKKIHGRLWTHVYLSKEPLDAAELMRRLDISKSLASITINDLLKYQVILQKGKGPNDTFVYVANPDVRSVILDILRNRETQMLSQTAYEQSVLLQQLTGQRSQTVNAARLESLGRMIAEAQVALTAIIGLSEVDFSKLNLR